MIVTYNDIKDMFYESVRDREDVQSLFNNDQVGFFCNKALAELAESVEYIDEDIIMSAGTDSERVIATDQMRVNRVEWDDKKMCPTTIEALETMTPTWNRRTGTPTRYYLGSAQQGVDGQLVLGLWSTPSDDRSLRVSVYGAVESVSDATGTTALQVPSWFAYNLLWSMLSDAYTAKTNIQNFEVAQFYAVLFSDAKKRLVFRTATKLPKEWAYETGSNYTGRAIDRMPLHIPSP